MAEKNRYSTGDMQSMFGMSNKGLFLYEKKGIIAPKRMDNQYRVFTMKDCSRFFMSRIYRELRFSLDECVDLAGATLEEVKESLEEKEQELRREARLHEELAVQAQHLHELLERIAQGDTAPREVLAPPMLRMESLPQKRGNAPENSESFRQWFSYLPFSAASILYQKDTLTGTKPVQYNLGFVMEKSVAEMLGIKGDDSVSLLPARRCLYMMIGGSETGFDENERIAPMLTALKSCHKQLTGNPYSRMVGVFHHNGKAVRYDELWCPI